MLKFESGDKEELKGRAAIYGQVTDLSYIYGSFLTIELSDIIYLISQKFKYIKEDLEKLSDFNKGNSSDANSKITFYSVGLNLVFLSDLKNLCSDFCYLGNRPSYLPDDYEEFEKARNSYINGFLNQNFPKVPQVKDLETSIDLSTKDIRIFVMQYLIPYDHYSLYRGDSMWDIRDIILNDYFVPIRRALNQKRGWLAEEMINRFRHFTEGPALNQSREDLIEVIKNIDSHLKDYRLYLDLVVSLIDENYENAAKIRDNISKFELNKVFHKILNTNDAHTIKEIT